MNTQLFLNRTIDTINQRARSRESVSLEGLQRETNRLLRQLVIEQQIQGREREFEARTFNKRPPSCPSNLGRLFAFHDSATNAGDDAAREWARRKLVERQADAPDIETYRRIGEACARPDVFDRRLADRYVSAMEDQGNDALERFLAEAVASKDVNACVAAFLLAHGSEEGTRSRWVRLVLNAMTDFPDAALRAMRGIGAELVAQEEGAAR